MNILHVLRFTVNNHTIGLVGIMSNIEQFAILGTTICQFFQTSNTGRNNTEVISIHEVVDLRCLHKDKKARKSLTL